MFAVSAVLVAPFAGKFTSLFSACKHSLEFFGFSGRFLRSLLFFLCLALILSVAAPMSLSILVPSLLLSLYFLLPLLYIV